ncbi:HdeD family acid-resistance protein [Streptomyces sp. NPDC059467]|uniref:HdeD family acid-resistance protein n=1 Tax=Streptomyces sp. NPDC059467 TaxID=3346844 RepID=UPI0036B39707
MNKSPVARLGASWTWHLLYGLVSIVIGVIAVAWPGPTLVVLAVVLGAQLIATGVFRMVGSASLGDTGTARTLTAVLGVVSLLLGLYAIRHVLITVLALGLLLGVYWIVDGFTAVFAAVDHPGLPGRGWNIFIGLLGVLAGLTLLTWPGLSLLTLSFLAGLWLIMLGAMQLGLARRIRGITRPA